MTPNASSPSLGTNELRTMSPAASDKSVIRVEKFNLFYGTFQALKEITMSIPRNRVTAIIGPSGCGKSTLLRSINRMNDLYGVRTEGQIFVNETPVYGRIDLVELRKKVGM